VSTYVLEPTNKHRASILENLKRFLDSLDPAKPWEITIERFAKERTIAQNKALFGLAYPLLREATGFDVGVMHNQFCKKFFGAVVVRGPMGNESLPRRTTTTDENGKRDVIPWDEFQKFFEMVQRYGSEASVFIPDPDPFWREKGRQAA